MNNETEILQPLSNNQQQHIILRVIAQVFSVIFHPLFIPFYVIGFLVYWHPSYFSGFSAFSKFEIMRSVLVNTIIFPAFSLLVMKGLGFIKSIMLHTQQDRIGPYLVNMIFYFWMARVFFNFKPEITPVLATFMTGVFLTTAIALIANIFNKISMHAIGCGGMLGIFIIVMNSNTMWMAWPLALAILITGIVCTSRLIVSDHTTKEIYTGLLVGLVCQFGAAFVIL